MKYALGSFQKQVTEVQTTEERNTQQIDDVKRTYSDLYRENTQLTKQMEISSKRIEDLQTKVGYPLFFSSSSRH